MGSRALSRSIRRRQTELSEEAGEEANRRDEA
jgi:hypothetical protein